MKIALVQFYSYHEEIIAPQIDFLLPDNKVYVAAPQEVLQHEYITFFGGRIKKIAFRSKHYNAQKLSHLFLRVFSILLKYIALYNEVKRHGIECIVFNTITGAFHFALIKLFFNKQDKVHIIHNAQAYTHKMMIKKLQTFKKNLFISKDVCQYYCKKHVPEKERDRFDWFLPGLAVFAGTAGAAASSGSASAGAPYDTDAVTIVVPGSVDDRRRDYTGLFDAVESVLKSSPSHNAKPSHDTKPRSGQCLQIILLGKISAEKQKMIFDRGLDGVIQTFAAYVPGSVMLAAIEKADALALLVDKAIGKNCGLYNRYKATGTSVFCLSFGIPVITSDDFELDSGLKNKALHYSGTHIETVLGDIVSGALTKADFKRLKNTSVPSEYGYDFQRRHYRALLGITETVGHKDAVGVCENHA